jgi:hypothetical protein
MLRLLIEGIDGGRVERLSAGHADHYMSSSRMSALKLIADSSQTLRYVRKVPISVISQMSFLDP